MLEPDKFFVFYFDESGFAYIHANISNGFKSILTIGTCHAIDPLTTKDIQHVAELTQKQRVYCNNVSAIKDYLNNIKFLEDFDDKNSIATLNIYMQMGDIALADPVKETLKSWKVDEEPQLIIKPILLLAENLNTISGDTAYFQWMRNGFTQNRRNRNYGGFYVEF